MLADIYRRAEILSRTAPPEDRARFDALRHAASMQALYLPTDLRAQLYTKERRRVLKVYGRAYGNKSAQEVLMAEEVLTSPVLYRLRGEASLNRYARIAAAALFLVGSFLLWVRGGAEAPRVLLGNVAALAAGVAVLHVLPAPAFGGAEPALLLIAAAVLSPSVWFVIPLGVSAALAPGAFLQPAAATAAAVLLAALARPRASGQPGSFMSRVTQRSGPPE